VGDSAIPLPNSGIFWRRINPRKAQIKMHLQENKAGRE
jgi:hypothetical protein